ncbi:MAG TPA: hypothetical protein VFQ35_14665 [Polyangiaceae bacterium]|nr:hypothetical protein [Polyangiaceae bacterium]
MHERSRWAARRAKSPAAIVSGILFAAIVRPALASPAEAPSVELEWVGPGTEAVCLGAAGLTRAVNDYLGRAAISDPPGERRVLVEVERRPGSWRARIELIDAQSNASLGEREIIAEGALCSGLDEPLKLSVALLVDSDLTETPAAGAHEAPRPPTPTPEPPAPTPTPPRDEPPPLFPARPWRFSWEASLLALNQVLPTVAVGAEVGLEAWASDSVVLRAHGAAFAPQTHEVTADTAYKATVLYGGLGVCPGGELAPKWRLFGCFGFEGGGIWVTRTGFNGGKDAARRLLAGSLGTRLTYDLGSKLSLGAQFSVLLPLQQERFVADADGKRQELFGISPACWVVGLGVASAL